ncbi:MAG: DNA cytosine methyltransferase [Muribaculaceae bacterium]
MPKKNLKIISLFSGAGGLDIGFDRAGFKTAVAVELDPSCCDTLRTNMPDLPTDITANDREKRKFVNRLRVIMKLARPSF